MLLAVRPAPLLPTLFLCWAELQAAPATRGRLPPLLYTALAALAFHLSSAPQLAAAAAAVATCALQVARRPFAALVGGSAAESVRRSGGPTVLLLSLAAAADSRATWTATAAAVVVCVGVVLAPKGRAWPPKGVGGIMLRGCKGPHAAAMAAASALLIASCVERAL